MENILLKRFKSLSTEAGKFVVGLAVMVTIMLLLYFSAFSTAPRTKDEVYASVLRNIRQVEHLLERKIYSFGNRAQSIYNKYIMQTLQHTHLEDKEALVLEENNSVKRYWGEIYHFKYKNMKTGEWSFIEKNNDIYYTRKMSDNTYYFHYFIHLENNPLREVLDYTFVHSELRFLSSPLIGKQNQYSYDENQRMFFYDHQLQNSNGQLNLYLKFSRAEIDGFYRNRQYLFFFSCLLLILVYLLVFTQLYVKRALLVRILWLVMLTDLYFLLPLALSSYGEGSLYLRFLDGGITIDSIYQLLTMVLFLVSALYFLRNKFKIKILSYILFNGALAAVLAFNIRLFGAVTFNYQSYSLNYIALLILLFFLHLLPLVFIRGIAPDFYKSMHSTQEKVVKGAIYLLLQVLIVTWFFPFKGMGMVSGLLLSLVSFILLFFKRTVLARVVVIFLISVSIFQLTSGFALTEKRDYISENLKLIFLNQSNYAKFIAREIIYQINSQNPKMYELFQDDTSPRLEDLWSKTIASRENIASGIFVVPKDDKILSHFSFQIPFLKAKTRNLFPVWAVEDTYAENQGEEIPLAAASISISKETEHLGRIVVQVLDSPELLLRYQENINIFTIDKKIDGKDLSYIKLNQKNNIVENPSNINLENVTGILKQNNQWIRFESLEMEFVGYIFKSGGFSTIIFYPDSTLFTKFSQVIQIFLLYAFLYLVFFMKDMKKIQWSSVYYSYSLRVFSLLIFISLLTAIVFSIFFINFSYRNSEHKVMRIMYENGRMAQNIGYNLIKGDGDFSRRHIFSIADVLNGDVSVYEKGELMDTSNPRKLLSSQIPVFIHSRIASLLNDKNQRFVLIEDDKGFHLFYKLYDYTVLVEYSNKWEENLSESGYYTDFIITLFFILMVIGIGIAFFFRNKILSPIDGLNKGMAEVEIGNLPVLTEIPQEIEIKSLYTGFNDMINGIREQKKSISEISRMKTIIRLGRHVAHEVKNPLTPIKLSAEQILLSLKDKNPNYEQIIKQSVNYIIDETEHLKKVSYGFLDLSKLDTIDTEEFDIMDLVRDEMFNVQQLYSHIDFSVEVDGSTEVNRLKLLVTMDRIKIKQVLKNLINNSIEAIGEKMGELRVHLQHSGQRLILDVIDNGVGMDQSDRAFESDYSTKEVGTGLGLFIVKRIIELHKGHINIKSTKNEGTCVTLDLPLKA